MFNLEATGPYTSNAAALLKARAKMQRLSLVMSDLAIKLPSVDTMVPRGQALGYPTFGMPSMYGYLWNLRCTWLHNTLETVRDGSHFAYFAEHALELAKAWFAKLLAGGYDGAEEDHILDPSPYFRMFGECLLQSRLGF